MEITRKEVFRDSERDYDPVEEGLLHIHLPAEYLIFRLRCRPIKTNLSMNLN